MNPFILNRVERLYRYYDVTAMLADGSPAEIAGVSVALLPLRATPTAETEWLAADYSEGTVTLLLAGPDAEAHPGAVVVPQGGADLWLRVADVPEVDVTKVEWLAVA